MQQVEQVEMRMITYKRQWLKVQWWLHNWKNRQFERLQSLSVRFPWIWVVKKGSDCGCVLMRQASKVVPVDGIPWQTR